MKIKDDLFSLSLAFILTLILMVVIFNVNAADKSICNPSADVVLYRNGSIKSCQLKDDYDVNNITCKNGDSISLYSNGKLESCVLYNSVSIGKNNCKEDALIAFYRDGKLKSCMKQDN